MASVCLCRGASCIEGVGDGRHACVCVCVCVCACAGVQVV